MKPQIRIEIIPLYRCNEKCSFCLYQHEKNNPNTMELAWIDESLLFLQHSFNIAQIKITGGEISLLSDLYFEMLYNIVKIYCKKIIVETNFLTFKKALINNCDIINVGYNFNGFSPIKSQIFKNIKAAVDTGKIINIKSLDISCQTDQSQIIEQLNQLKIKSWEIIPFHQTKYTSQKFKDYDLYENTVKTFIKLSNKMKFSFQNKLQLDNILNIDNYNIKTIYLTPNNKFAIQVFDENANFELQEFENISDLQKKLTEMEKIRDNFCKSCTSKLQCMSNYFMNPFYHKTSCSGFHNLISEFKNRKP